MWFVYRRKPKRKSGWHCKRSANRIGITQLGTKSVKQNEILPSYDEPSSLHQLPIDDELQEVVARRQAAHF